MVHTQHLPPVSGLGGRHWTVKQAALMDTNISTIEDYRQYLLSVQKIYLKHTRFVLPIDSYAQELGLRGAFREGQASHFTRTNSV